MTDEVRVAQAVRSGRRMLGPAERQRCARHPKRWEIYRWTWDVGDVPENGETELVRGCGSCSEEAE